MKDIQKPLGDLAVTVEPDMSSRVVFIRDNAGNMETQGEMQLSADTDRFSNLNLSLVLPGFELSLHDEVPAERFLLYVMRIKLKVKISNGAKKEADEEDGAEVVRHANQMAVKLDIQHVQLDNMSNSSSEFPIIFGGTDKFAATLVSPEPENPSVKSEDPSHPTPDLTYICPRKYLPMKVSWKSVNSRGKWVNIKTWF